MKRFGATGAAALLGGVLVFLLLFPVYGNDSDPPECFAVLNYVVPCGFGHEQRQGAGFAILGASVAVGLVIGGAAAGRRDRDRASRDSAI